MISHYEMVPLSAFTPLITFNYEGLPEPIAEEYARMALIEIGEALQCIVREVEIIPQECVNDYILRLPEDERAVTILGISGGSLCGTGLKNDITIEATNRIRIQSLLVEQDDPLTVRVSTVPTQTACVVDSQYLELYKNVVVEYVLWKTATVANTPFFNPVLAALHQREYENQLTRAIIARKLKGRRGKVNINSGRIV